MENWGQGYVTDLEYTAGFYTEQSPAALRLACLLNGVDISMADDFTYCELGCGVGMTTLVLAASNPRARFVAVDFNPVHVLKARSVARAAGLTNIEFLELSFEDLAGGLVDVPQFDFITLHGVYSWVTRETRQQIVAILKRWLKSGGVAYVSYNAMPGSAQRLPIQRLLWDLAALSSSRSDQRIAKAIEQMTALKNAGARTLTKSDFTDDPPKQLAAGGGSYLAHEYLNDNWNPMYHADVCRELAAAKLTYAGSANLLYAFDQMMLDSAQREVLESLQAPHLRETIRDFCSGLTFRKDVFVRGAQHLSPGRQNALLGGLKLALLVPRADFKFEIAGPAGKGDLDREVYGAVADALAEGPRSVADLLALPTLPKTSRMTAVELTGILVGTQQAAVLVEPPIPPDQAAADRLTLALVELLDGASGGTVVGIPVAALGTGLRFNTVEYTVLRNLLLHGKVDVDGLAAEQYEAIIGSGGKVLKEGQPVEGKEEGLEVLRQRVRGITERMLPIWQQFWPRFGRA